MRSGEWAPCCTGGITLVSKVHPVYGTVAVGLWVASAFCVAGTVMYGPPMGTFALVAAVMAATCTIVAFVRGGQNWLMAHRLELTGQAIDEITKRVLVELRGDSINSVRPTVPMRLPPMQPMFAGQRVYASAPLPPPVPPIPTLPGPVEDGTYAKIYQLGRESVRNEDDGGA